MFHSLSLSVSFIIENLKLKLVYFALENNNNNDDALFVLKY